MRSLQNFRLILATLTVLITPLAAQTTYSKLLVELMSRDIANAAGYANVGFAPAVLSIPGKPFSAKRVYTDRCKTDGPNLSAEFTIARDSLRRVHYEMAFEKVFLNKLAIAGYDVQIYDPIAHQWYRYFENADHGLPSKPVAELRILSPMSKLQRPAPSAANETSGDPPPDALNPVATPPTPDEKSPAQLIAHRGMLDDVPSPRDLPKQSINGIAAFGHRDVIRYGKNSEYSQIQENWLSPEWAVDMRQIVLRETIGEETVETRDLTPGEPDPMLFHVPRSYIVHKVR